MKVLRGRTHAWRIALVLLAGVGCLGARGGDLARGDALWDARARGANEGRPLVAPIRGAVQAYERALEARPEGLEARWKVLRALHFEGEFASADAKHACETFDRGCEIAEAGLERLARDLGSAQRLDELAPDAVRALLDSGGIAPQDAARLHFWSAIHWAAAARARGLLAAVRDGAANRLHRYASLAIALEPDYDEGGALRLLGRLHASLPRVPFVSGWVDRSQALPLIERAWSIAPENPGNRLLLALTLLDQAPEREGEADRLLEQVAELVPRPSMRVEDLAMQRAARERRRESRASR